MHATNRRLRSILCESVTRRADNGSEMRIPDFTPANVTRPRTGVVLSLLAALLILALSPAAVAQQANRVLVIEPVTNNPFPLVVTENTTATNCQASYGVRLSTAPTGNVTVTVASGDTKVATVVTPATATLTFTSANTGNNAWNSAQTVTVQCVDDLIDNPDDERSVTFTNTPSGGGFSSAASVTVTVYDNDEAALKIIDSSDQPVTNVAVDEKARSSYRMKLNSEPTGNVVVTLASDDTGIATVTPGSITFTATNWNVTQNVVVSGVDDDEVNASARNTKITHTPSGGGYGAGESEKVNVAVSEPDTVPAAGLVFSPTQPVVVEGQQATYTVKLNTKPTGSVALDLSETSLLVRISPNLLRFTTTNWNKAQTVTVDAKSGDDEIDNEANDTAFASLSRKVSITHQPSGGGYGSLDTGLSLTVGVRDNDTRGLLLSRKSVTLVDAGNTVSYTVALKTEPTAAVTVAVGENPESAAVTSVTPASLSFTTDNWKTRQTITVTAQNDSVDDGASRSAKIKHEPDSGGYGDPEDTDLTVTVENDDTAELLIDKTTLTIAEGSTQTYKVKLRSDPITSSNVTSRDVSVSVSASSGAQLSAGTLTFDGTNWNTYQTVTVTGVADSVDNVGNRTGVITHTATGYVTGSKTVKVTVTDKDPQSGIVVSPTSLSIYDSNDTADTPAARTKTYTVRLRSKPTADTSVALEVIGVPVQVSALADFQPCGTSTGDTACDDTSITNAWNKNQTVTVTVTPDDEDNGDRIGSIKHTATGLTGAETKVTVKDDDDAEVLIRLVSTSSRVTEGGTVQYAVKLKSAPSHDDFKVNVLSDDPRIAAVTTPSTGALTFTTANWGTEQTVTVTATDDEVDDRLTSRSVYVSFVPGGGDGYGPAEARRKTVTVVEDDDAKLVVSPSQLTTFEDGSTTTYTVKLATKPKGTVTVKVSSGSTGTATVKPETLTFRPVAKRTGDGPPNLSWADVQRVTVTGVRAATRGDRTATITNAASGGGYDSVRASVTVTVKEDESEGLRIAPQELTVKEGATGTFGVELNTKPDGEVTVAVTSDKSDVATVAPASLTFSSTNWNKAQQVTVSARENNEVTDKEDREVTITFTSSGSDYDFVATGRVNVTENDAELEPSRRSVAMGETGRASFTVSLTGRPTGTVTVNLTSSAPTVATVSPASLTFTTSNYSRAQNVTVRAVPNDVDDPNDSRSATITFEYTGGGYDEVVTEPVTVTVNDDEGLEVLPEVLSVAEAGGTAAYTVKLRSQPVAAVTVAVVSSNPNAATVTPATLTFTTANYDSRQTVTVIGVDDDVDNRNDQRRVTVTNTPSNAGYRTPEPVQVTVTDDDAAPTGITLTVSPSRVREDDPSTVVTVSAALDGTTRFAAAQVVTVSVGANDGDATEATAGTDYAAVPGFTLTIAAGAASGTGTFTLSPIDDAEFEGDQTVTVSGKASGVPVSGDTITIEDDDTITVRLSGSATVAEGETAEFPVSIVEGAVSVDVVVTYTVGGTATPGDDYYTDEQSGSLRIPAGSATGTISIPTNADDDVLDPGETLVVELTGATTPSGEAVIATPKQFTTTIEDSGRITVSVDSPTAVEGNQMVFTVKLEGTASTVAEAMTVLYTTVDGTAKAGEDYTAVVDKAVEVKANRSEARFTVDTLRDDEAEPNETFTVKLSEDPAQPLPDGVEPDTTPATATIEDDDLLTVTLTGTETVLEREAASFTVTLSQPLEEQVTVSYETADGTASAGADYTAADSDAAATIAVGETAATFMVATTPDTKAEDNETFSVRLTAVNRSAALATLKIDPDPLPEATVTIEDDDELTVSVTVPPTVVEGEAAIYTVSLQGGTGSEAVEVDYEVGGTATSGKDFTAPSGGLVIPVGDTKGTITIWTLADKVVDPNETLVVKLLEDGTTTAAGSVAVGRPSTATTTIVDPVYESINRVNEAVLPEIARAAAASTLDAVGRRMERGATGPAPAAAADLAGLTGFYRALQANERALQDGSYDLAQVLSGTSFLVPLSAHEEGADPGIGFAFWGSGDYRNISGGDPDEADVDWGGSAWSARLGADARFVDSLLTGLALSWTASALEYEDDTGGADRSGTHGTSLISVHPYVGWTTPDFGVWATGGLGWGEVTIDDDEAEVDAPSTGLSHWSLGAGASVTVLAIDDLIAGGTTALKLRGEGLLAHATVEAAATVAGLEVDVNQVRAVVEASHAQRLGTATLTPVLELGGRLDGGDGETGAGFEVGGGVSYADAGFTVESRGRVLLFRDNFDEWGLSGLVQYDPGAPAHGLMVSVRPAFGATASGVAGLWEHGTLDLLGSAEQAGGRVEAEIGYGVPVFGAAGVLTPFAGASLTDAGGNSLSLGSRLLVAPLFEVSLEALRSESPAGATPEHGLTLEGAIRW